MIRRPASTAWREGILAGLLGLVVFRVLTEGIGLLAAYRGGAPRRLLEDPGILFGIWQQWDVNWFSNIATMGYPALGHVVVGANVQDAVAFPPGVPALMAAGRAVGLVPAATGVLLSAVFLLVSLVLLYVLVRQDHGDSIARWTLAFLLVYPFAFFLGTPYAESLVLLGTVGAWAAARRGWWSLAGLLVAVALLAKIVFVLLLVPLSLEALEWSGGRTLIFTRAGWRRLVALWVPALMGAVAWMVYLQVTFGEPLRFLSAEKGWGRALGLPLGEVGFIFTPGGNAGLRFIDAIDLLSLLLLAGMTVYVYRRVRATYAVLLGLLLAVFVFDITLVSNGRHLSVLFPIFIGFALMTRERRWLRPLLAAAQLPLAVLLVARFATGHWAG